MDNDRKRFLTKIQKLNNNIQKEAIRGRYNNNHAIHRQILENKYERKALKDMETAQSIQKLREDQQLKKKKDLLQDVNQTLSDQLNYKSKNFDLNLYMRMNSRKAIEQSLF